MTENNNIYFDYQATTPTDKRVLDKIYPYFAKLYGNPHVNEHISGRIAGMAVEKAREQVAKLINAKTKEIIFTSGATESNNMAIKGGAKYRLEKTGKNHIITLATEHKSVLESVKSLKNKGFDISILPLKNDGLLDLNLLRETITDKTSIISIMAVNGEIGVIQDLVEIGKIAKKNDIWFHCDAAQGLGHLKIDVKELNIAMLSMSSHKIYGTKGVGGLYLNKSPSIRANILPLFSGGGQEMGLRSGTLPVPLCVGFGCAADILKRELPIYQKQTKNLADYFLKKLKIILPNIKINGSIDNRITGNLNLTIIGVSGDDLREKLSNIDFSYGSACSSGSSFSYVLAAIGHNKASNDVSFRISFGRNTTKKEVDILLSKMAKI